MIFPLPPILTQLAVSLALTAISVALQPRQKAPKAKAGKVDLPVASAGDPIPVVFGTVTITDPNVVWTGEKRTKRYRL